MTKSNLRGEPRLPHARRATLTFNGVSSAGLIQDVSMKGFLIMSTKKFDVGDVLDLRSELYKGQFLECRIEVRHVMPDDCMGTRIVEISEPAERLCRQFIEEHYADKYKFGS